MLVRIQTPLRCLLTTTRMEASKQHTPVPLCKILKLATVLQLDLLPPTHAAKLARQRHGDSDRLLVPVVSADMLLGKLSWFRARF
jgi:hypothetical protein